MLSFLMQGLKYAGCRENATIRIADARMSAYERGLKDAVCRVGAE